jgi:hypothetical protein
MGALDRLMCGPHLLSYQYLTSRPDSGRFIASFFSRWPAYWRDREASQGFSVAGVILPKRVKGGAVKIVRAGMIEQTPVMHFTNPGHNVRRTFQFTNWIP